MSLGIAVVLDQLGIVASRRGQPLFEFGQAGAGCLHTLVASHGFFEHGALRIISQVLREITELQVAGSVNGTFVGFDLAHQHADEGGLACAVTSYQGNTTPRSEFERDIFEEPTRPKGHSKIRRRKHACEAIAGLVVAVQVLSVTFG